MYVRMSLSVWCLCLFQDRLISFQCSLRWVICSRACIVRPPWPWYLLVLPPSRSLRLPDVVFAMSFALTCMQQGLMRQAHLALVPLGATPLWLPAVVFPMRLWSLACSRACSGRPPLLWWSFMILPSSCNVLRAPLGSASVVPTLMASFTVVCRVQLLQHQYAAVLAAGPDNHQAYLGVRSTTWTLSSSMAQLCTAAVQAALAAGPDSLSGLPCSGVPSAA